MGNTNDVETTKETEEEHFNELCCIEKTGRTANGAYKFVRKCYCTLNLPPEELYHHSHKCNYSLLRNNHGGFIIKMICYCEGQVRSYHR
jgi:hypothetical protein